jgi:hypothetical protein
MMPFDRYVFCSWSVLQRIIGYANASLVIFPYG